MALEHIVVEQRAYLNTWLSIVNVTDSQTGRVWDLRFNPPTQPTQGELDALIADAKAEIQKALDIEGNDMNLPTDELRAREYLLNIKRDIIVLIRQNPNATLQQAQNYVDTNYPNSIINFDKLYQFYLNLLGLSTWSEFKTWVIGHKFREVD